MFLSTGKRAIIYILLIFFACLPGTESASAIRTTQSYDKIRDSMETGVAKGSFEHVFLHFVNQERTKSSEKCINATSFSKVCVVGILFDPMQSPFEGQGGNLADLDLENVDFHRVCFKIASVPVLMDTTLVQRLLPVRSGVDGRCSRSPWPLCFFAEIIICLIIICVYTGY